MQIQALDLRPGVLISHEKRMCTVVWWNILRNDRRQFVQLRIKDLETGRVQEIKSQGDTRYEVLEKEEREIAHSYRDGPAEVFFTPEGEEIRCPTAACEDALLWPAESYSGFFVEGNLVAVFPPKHAIVTITETSPPIKNAGTGQKEAVLENGLKVKVNMLCKTGDKVRLDTETREFKERIAK